MTKWLSRAAFPALLIIAAARADAQITTVIGAPKRADLNQQQTTVRREAAAQDSIARVTLTGMKEWVDSAAAALALRPDTGRAPVADSATPTVSTPAQQPRVDSTPTPTHQPAQPPPEFRDGARAPNTGTALPTVAVVGFALLLIGLGLGRRRGAPIQVRARR